MGQSKTYRGNDQGWKVDARPLTLMELLRVGSSELLKHAIAGEIAEYLGRPHYGHSSEERPLKGYRNGTRKTRIDTPSGQVEYDRPILAYAPEFRSRYHRPNMRRPEEFSDAIASMYVEGVSTRKIKRALSAVTGDKARLSRSTVSRITEKLREDFRQWKVRDLSHLKPAYLFLDAIRIGIRLENTAKDSVLVAYTALEDGSFELLAIGLGNSESEDVWTDFLVDLKKRGLVDPLLVVSDGNQGLINSIEKCFPTSYRQRCVKHRMENILTAIPKENHVDVRRQLNFVFYGATSLEQAKGAVEGFRKLYQKKFPTAVQKLLTDLPQALTYYIFPKAHWRRIRTTNKLERMNLEIRRRLNVVGRHPSEDGCLALVYQVCKRYANGKYGFKSDELVQRLWQKLRQDKKDMITQLELDLKVA